MYGPSSQLSGGLCLMPSPQNAPRALQSEPHLPYAGDAGKTFVSLFAPSSHASNFVFTPSPHFGTHSLFARAKPLNVTA